MTRLLAFFVPAVTVLVFVYIVVVSVWGAWLQPWDES